MGNKIINKSSYDKEDFSILISDDKIINRNDLIYIFHILCKKYNKNIFYILNSNEIDFTDSNSEYKVENYNCNESHKVFTNFLKEFKPSGLVKMDFIPIWIKLYFKIDEKYFSSYIKSILNYRCLYKYDDENIISLDLPYNSFVRDISTCNLYVGLAKIYINDIISKINFQSTKYRLYFLRDFLRVEYINILVVGFTRDKVDYNLDNIKKVIPYSIYKELQNKIDFKRG